MSRFRRTSPAEQRDLALARAERLKIACAGGAAAMTLGVVYLAAGSFPGRAAATTSSQTATVAGSSSVNSDQAPAQDPGLQPPQQAPQQAPAFGGFSGPIISSGGS
jgi:hypothetical protein